MVGKKLSHYRILELIGAGGMGVVYRAHDEQLDRDVAIKVLPHGSLADEAARRRFREEALSLARLNHPNIATVQHNFLLKRVFRIVPLYWIGTFGVFLLALLMPALLSGTRASLGNLIKSLFLIPYRREDGELYPMLFLGWTLEYEMFFYFIFGLALMLFKKWASPAASFTLIAIVVAGKVFHACSTIPQFYSNPLIIEFVFGMAVFAVWNRYHSAFTKFPVAAALVISVGCDAYLYHVTSHASYNDRIFLEGLPALTIVLCFLVLEGRVKFPMWFLIIGDASYSLYLFHPYIIQLVDKEILSLAVITPFSLMVSVAAILACFVAAIISFRLIEKPSNQFLRRYLVNVHPQPTEPAPV